jgi:hypothetical protein
LRERTMCMSNTARLGHATYVGHTTCVEHIKQSAEATCLGQAERGDWGDTAARAPAPVSHRGPPW